MGQIPRGTLAPFEEHLREQVQAAERDFFSGRQPLKLIELQETRELLKRMKAIRKSYER